MTDQSTQHTAHSTQRRVLAVDVGEQRIGIAVSDPLGFTAQPVEVWQHQSVAADVAHIVQLARDYQAGTVVVGHPVTLAGTRSAQTIKAEQFAAALTAECPCAVELVDERLTTAQGERALLEGNVRRSDRRRVIDRVAAQLLLQHYLERQRGVPPHDIQ